MILNALEITVLEEISEILKPWKELTTALSSETAVTVSLIAPSLHNLLCKALMIKEEDSEFAQQMKQVMKTDLSKRYQESNIKLFLHVASVLDPRFKKLFFLSEQERLATFDEWKKIITCHEEKNQVKKPKIKLEASTCPPLPSVSTDTSAEETPQVSPPSSPPIKRQKLAEDTANDFFGNFFGDLIITKVESAPSMFEKIEEEMQMYMSMPQVSPQTDVLAWWQMNAAKLPMIARVVKQILCVPVTSTPSERAFSKAGNLITAKRALLKPEKVDMVLFLNKNYNLSL